MIADVRSLELKNKTVLVRCDFNVSLKDGKIADSSRIDASLETIRLIITRGAAAVLCSHLDRPKKPTPELSLKPVAKYLGDALKREVAFAPCCVGRATLQMVNSLPMGGVLLLENLRFHPEEEANDPAFARELVRGKQAYVNDAFASAHRAHASTVGVTRFLTQRAAGLLMMRELDALFMLREDPAHPYVAILGGSKVGDKIGFIRNLLTKLDVILVGGAMAYTFLKAEHIPVGKSKVEEGKIGLARELLDEAVRHHVKVVLPLDHVVGPAPAAHSSPQIVTSIPPDQMALDIGPATIERFIAELATVRTVVWNGPLGVCEFPAFAQGTLKVGEAVARSRAHGVLGGGDTVAALGHTPWAGGFSHFSTGGGATLEFLKGRELPGVKALER